MKRFVIAAMALAGATVASPAAAQGACTRELLQGIADSWVAGVEEGTPFKMNLGEWVEYKENMELGFMSVFFDKPRKVDWHRTLLDTTACKATVESVVLDPEHPMVLTTQLTNGFFGVSPIENVVSDKGDWQFDAAAAMERGKSEAWDVIPEGQRQTRQQLVAAADAYLDGLAGTVGEATERQFVVDETLGAVNAFVRVGAGRRPESHTLRIENGQVRFAHVATPAPTR
jgi:hypothetical protein